MDSHTHSAETPNRAAAAGHASPSALHRTAPELVHLFAQERQFAREGVVLEPDARQLSDR